MASNRNRKHIYVRKKLTFRDLLVANVYIASYINGQDQFGKSQDSPSALKSK